MSKPVPDIHVVGSSCAENPFCAGLSQKLRERLCQGCIKTSFAAKSSVEFNSNNLLLILDGLCCMDCNGMPFDVCYRGELMFYPTTGDGSFFNVKSDYPGNVDLATTGRLVTLENVDCAVFRRQLVEELLDDPEFARAFTSNLMAMYQHAIGFNICVYRADARDAVKFVVEYAKGEGYDYLTHEQIAYLTGLSRSTVTHAMHELALSE